MTYPRVLALLAILVTIACGTSSAPTSFAPILDDAGALSSATRDGGAADSGAIEAGAHDGGAPDGAAADAGTTGNFVVRETFNAMTTGQGPSSPWTTQATNGGAVTVSEIPFPADKSVTITKPATAGTSALSLTFPAQRGRIVFEAKVLARETAGFKAIPYIYDAQGDAVASVSFQDGSIQTHAFGAVTTVQSFVANEWYRVRVAVDTRQGTFDLYIDGAQVAAAQALRTPSSSVSAISYYVDGTTADTLLVDNVKIYDEAVLVGAPPAPVFDPRKYGAIADGKANDQAALQMAIDAAAGTGGSVVLTGGTFASGTLTLGSEMTFFIDASATLLGSASPADYPTQTPDTGNTQLLNCKRALLYAPDVTNLTIDGGGMIDGQGDSFSGIEGTRPLLIWAVKSDHVTVKNVFLRKGAVWSLVSMETDDVLITNVGISSDGITHDGIDIVDGKNVTVDDVAVRSGDDAMCLKSGVRRGIDTLTVRDSLFGGSGSSGGSNGIKFGTATYGALTNITIEDDYVKDVQYAAMAVESRQGSDVSQVAFSRIEFADTGAAFFVYLAQQSDVAPTGDVPKLGSVSGISFTDVTGRTAAWANSPHQGSLFTGQIYDGTTYPISNLAFSRVNVTFDGGLSQIPGNPVEATPDQYPESNMFGDLPAWGYYLRHVQGVTFDACTSSLAAADARQKLVTSDVSALTGAP